MTSAIKVFLGFAILCYPFVLFMTWFIHGEPDGLLGGFALMAVLVMWLNLGIALLLAGIRNGIPWWSYLLAVPVVLMYLASAYSVTELLRTERVQWMIVVPAVGPLVMFAYIVWASIPQYRAMLSPGLASAGVWCVLLALSIVPSHKSQQVEERRQQEAAAAEALVKAHVAQLSQVGSDAPLADFAPFLEYYETRDLAVEKMRASARKESDMEQMMRSGDYSLVSYMWNLQIPVTPALCECGRTMLKELTVTAKTTAAKGGYVEILTVADRYVSAIRYLADHKCPIADELTAYIAALRSAPDPTGKWTYAVLDEIKRELEAP